jgi:hypothetical protein
MFSFNLLLETLVEIQGTKMVGLLFEPNWYSFLYIAFSTLAENIYMYVNYVVSIFQGVDWRFFYFFIFCFQATNVNIDPYKVIELIRESVKKRRAEFDP